jgi:integrase/recombinase XerD
MANRRSDCKKPRIGGRSPGKGSAKDVTVICGNFADYLRARNYAPFTVEHCQRHLMRIADWLREHPNQPALNELTRRMVPRLLAQVLLGRSPETRMNYRKAVLHWLRFAGRYSGPVTRPWAPWPSDYLQFLSRHQGVGQATRELNEASAKAFMEWQFGTARANWSRVQPTDIWRFASRYVRGVKPITGKSRLGYVRRFLDFVHLRGACGPELAVAIPKVAVCRAAPRPEVLSQSQRRKLLAFFRQTTPEGKRNYAMILCMFDLGLRGGEVIGLRLPDVDWKARRLNVRVTETGRGRQLPLPTRLLEALQDYIRTGRPQNASFDHVFLRHPRRRGYPLSRSVLKAMVRWAYSHCGFPST